MKLLFLLIPFASVWVRFLFEKIGLQNKLENGPIIIEKWSKCIFCYFTWINFVLVLAHCFFYKNYENLFCAIPYSVISIYIFNKHYQLFGEEARNGE